MVLSFILTSGRVETSPRALHERLWGRLQLPRIKMFAGLRTTIVGELWPLFTLWRQLEQSLLHHRRHVLLLRAPLQLPQLSLLQASLWASHIRVDNHPLKIPQFERSNLLLDFGLSDQQQNAHPTKVRLKQFLETTYQFSNLFLGTPSCMFTSRLLTWRWGAKWRFFLEPSSSRTWVHLRFQSARHQCIWFMYRYDVMLQAGWRACFWARVLCRCSKFSNSFSSRLKPCVAVVMKARSMTSEGVGEKRRSSNVSNTTTEWPKHKCERFMMTSRLVQKRIQKAQVCFTSKYVESFWRLYTAVFF